MLYMYGVSVEEKAEFHGTKKINTCQTAWESRILLRFNPRWRHVTNCQPKCTRKCKLLDRWSWHNVKFKISSRAALQTTRCKEQSQLLDVKKSMMRVWTYWLGGRLLAWLQRQFGPKFDSPSAIQISSIGKLIIHTKLEASSILHCWNWLVTGEHFSVSAGRQKKKKSISFLKQMVNLCLPCCPDPAVNWQEAEENVMSGVWALCY